MENTCNILMFNSSQCAQAHWWKRFSDLYPNIPAYIVFALKLNGRTPVDEFLIHMFDISHEPVFNEKGDQLIAAWVNTNKVKRPKEGVRFFERSNPKTHQYEVWLYTKF